MDAHAADDVRSHVKTYFMIFGALMVLTIVTVGVSYLHLPVAMAILVALVVATIKGSLVALYFMHLKPRAQAHLLRARAHGHLFHFPDVRSAVDEPGQDYAALLARQDVCP